VPKLLPRKTVRIAAGPPVDLSEFAGQPLTNAVLRAATSKIMTNVAALLGDLRGQTPPAEFYHPAVARRKLRQDLRTLQAASQPDTAGTDTAGTDTSGAETAAGDAAADGTATGTAAP